MKKMESEAALAKASDAMSKAAAPLAHDFNNALAAISGYATLIDDEMSASAPGKKELGQIIKAVNRAAEITAKLQSFAQNPGLGGQEDKKD
jgi:nitrogen-specific signal transduction histidine kinase